MRILMLSANTGEGHNSTAKAIMEVLEPMGVQCHLQDALAFLSPRFSKFICNWHVRLYKYGGKLVDAGYRAMERSADPEELPPVYDLLSLGAPKLEELLQAQSYDAVICVHVFAAMMMTQVRQRLPIPSYFVATDYTCSPTVEQCDMDGYFIPAQALAAEFIRAGLDGRRLIPSGIPVRQVFYKAPRRAAARQSLGLPQDALVTLLMCGSMGCGPMERIAEGLCLQMPENSVVVALCGSNEKLLELLRSRDLPGLWAMGYTTGVPELMDAADLIVTKPGGLSTTEAANKHLPMVLINSVGGCESRNFTYLTSRGCAAGSSDAEQVVDLSVMLAQDEGLRRRMQQALAADFSANSARYIAQYVASACQKSL